LHSGTARGSLLLPPELEELIASLEIEPALTDDQAAEIIAAEDAPKPAPDDGQTFAEIRDSRIQFNRKVAEIAERKAIEAASLTEAEEAAIRALGEPELPTERKGTLDPATRAAMQKALKKLPRKVDPDDPDPLAEEWTKVHNALVNAGLTWDDLPDNFKTLPRLERHRVLGRLLKAARRRKAGKGTMTVNERQKKRRAKVKAINPPKPVGRPPKGDRALTKNEHQQNWRKKKRAAPKPV
jgi:hypothetical protein